MRRACEACGTAFDAQRASARFCSDRCRKRVARSGAPRPQLRVVTEPEPRQRPDGSLLGAVLIALEEAQVLDTPGGRLAVSIATRLDDPNSTDSGSAVAALSRELRAVMAEATARSEKSSSPLDRIREGLRVV